MSFRNSPELKDEHGSNTIKRYVHQQLTIEHYGLHAKIQENGKVIIQGLPQKIEGSDEVEYDEIEVPAAFVFKLAGLLKATRSIQFISIENKKQA